MRIVRVLLLTGAELAGRATRAQSAPLTPNPLSPSAGRGGRTRKGGVLQPLLGLISVSLLLFEAQAFAQEVNVDFDKTANFKKFKTFAWKEGMSTGNPFADQRIKEAVELQLGSRGLRRAMNVDPDCLVVFHASTSEDLSLNTYYSGWGPGWYPYWGGPATVTTTVDRQKKGTLIVDLWDASTKKLFWRGVAQDTLSDKSEKNEKKIQKAAAKMFKQFPPPKK
jgi:uncharacterized protein DUF4136